MQGWTRGISLYWKKTELKYRGGREGYWVVVDGVPFRRVGIGSPGSRRIGGRRPSMVMGIQELLGVKAQSTLLAVEAWDSVFPLKMIPKRPISPVELLASAAVLLTPFPVSSRAPVVLPLEDVVGGSKVGKAVIQPL